MGFCLALVAIGMAVGSCATITPFFKGWYGVSPNEANFANLAYSITYIPFNFVSISVFKRFGLKVSIIIGAIMSVVGAWLRLLVYWTNFPVFLIASALCGCS